MRMEFQGKKATHDFLSLYNPLQDSMPPSSQGFNLNLKTHDFLKPLEKEAVEVEPAITVATSDPRNDSAGAVKSERVTYGAGAGFESKPEPHSGFGSYAGVAFTLWDNGSKAQPHWPSPFAASTSFAGLSSSRTRTNQNKKRLMESGSRGFDEEDEDDDEFGKKEGTSRKRKLSVKVDGRSGGNGQRGATTPRSKHSATEQRRRSRINDRFQILRELIPNNDQKRDKASFLLEVIKYIHFLQEKVQKYESSSYPGYGEENAKLIPWNTNRVPGDCTIDPSQVIRNGYSPGFIYPSDDNGIPPATGVLSTAQNPIDSDMSAGVLYKSVENSVGLASKGTVGSVPSQRLITHIDNLASHSQSQWLRPSDYSVSSDVISEQEELTVDEGTISVSAAYSENTLNSLKQALESSGIDLSQVNVSVQINLGKQAARRATTTTTSSAKDLEDPSSGNRPVIINSRTGSSGESEQAPKQAPKTHKSEDS